MRPYIHLIRGAAILFLDHQASARAKRVELEWLTEVIGQLHDGKNIVEAVEAAAKMFNIG